MNIKRRKKKACPHLREYKMYDEHLPLVIQLLDVGPAEVVCLAGALEREHSRVVETEVQLASSVILLVIFASFMSLVIHVGMDSLPQYVDFELDE